MAYMNDDIPYDKYIQRRERGRGRAGRQYHKNLTAYISFAITPKMRDVIDKIIQEEIFPNKAEFLRYLIVKFFEENKEWLK